MGRAHLLRCRELRFDHVDGDDLASASDARSLDGGESHATAAEDGHGRARFDLRRVEDCADARHDAAADESRPVEGHVVADLHAGVLVEKHVLGVAGDVEELVHGRAVPGVLGLVGRAAHARRVGAKVRPTAEAHVAVAAEHRQAADDVVARLHVGNLVADFGHDPGFFVAEDRRRRVG